MMKKAIIKQKHVIRFKGITADAASLGVTREHLWRVLTDRRESPGLLKRYSKLKKTKKEGNK